jgi:hypothetical protein
MTEIANRLTGLGYNGLFLTLDNAQLDALWATQGAPEALTQLASDPGADSAARFLAAEVLFRKQRSYPPKAAHTDLAAVYAEALRQARLANIWGMPGQLDGPAGQHLVALGEPAAAALIPLLDDSRRVIYGGSEEATEGNSYAYRVKDFAAFFISQIRKLRYSVDKTPAQRDAAIERLRGALR